MAQSPAVAGADPDSRGRLSGRLVSLDAFRGFTVAAMILVNNPGDWNNVYGPLAHAEWNGWTFTDTIFPSFLFICGVAMALSLQNRGRTPISRLVRRGAIIFLIGLALNLVPAFDLSTVRIPGVLQRIGLCIMIAAPVVVSRDWRNVAAFALVLLSVYAVVMLLVPVPDVQGRVAAGVLEPGRDAGAYIDRLLMGGHLWSKSRTWDPEGLLSTLPAAASLLFGQLAGRWVIGGAAAAEKTAWMMVAGIAALAAGAMLNVVLMPINKSLWSVSYCVFMTGWSLLGFATFFWLADGAPVAWIREGFRRLFLPFTIFGMNALFIFAVSGLVARLLGAWGLKYPLYAPFRTLPLAPVDASLLFAIAFDLAMLGLAWALWRRRWFIKV